MEVVVVVVFNSSVKELLFNSVLVLTISFFAQPLKITANIIKTINTFFDILSPDKIISLMFLLFNLKRDIFKQFS